MKTKTSYQLYLDETGIPNPITPANHLPYFILSGLLVNVFQNENLKIRAGQVKFKYWGRTDIIFHSREIGKREGDFAILKDPVIEAEFHNDLVNFMTNQSTKTIIVAVNKNSAVSAGWNEKMVYENAADMMISFFIEFLQKRRARGKIIVESSNTVKDIAFLKKYSYYLSNGFPSLGLSNSDIKDLLTAISFVSKRNFDIETQIADLLAYPASYRCLCDDGLKTMIPNSYEDRMCNVLQSKLVVINSKNSFIKLP